MNPAELCRDAQEREHDAIRRRTSFAALRSAEKDAGWAQHAADQADPDSGRSDVLRAQAAQARARARKLRREV